jgi:uncharacterized membrane protein
MDETTVTVDPRHVSYTHLMYALHGLSIVMGILSSAYIVVPFLFGMPSLIAVVMNLVRRQEVAGTWLESHFRWQLHTFLIALGVFICVSLVFGPLSLILIGLPFLILGYVTVGLWTAYRIVRGWIALRDGRTLRNFVF